MNEKTGTTIKATTQGKGIKGFTAVQKIFKKGAKKQIPKNLKI